MITIYRLIAWLMLIGVLVGILITLAIAIKSRGDAGAMLGLLITVGPALLTTTIVATFTLGVAESMKLALDIQSNTLAAAHAARRHD